MTAPPPAEVRSHQQVAVVRTPPRRSSVTVNGSPVVLKTPEILLKKVESPSRATPPKSLLATANKLQATPPQSQAPPTNSVRREVEVEVRRERGRQGAKSSRDMSSNHYPDAVRDHKPCGSTLQEDMCHVPPSLLQTANPLHSESPHNQDTSYRLPNQDPLYHSPNQEPSNQNISSSQPNQPNQGISYYQPNPQTNPQTNQDNSLCRPNQDTYSRPNQETSHSERNMSHRQDMNRCEPHQGAFHRPNQEMAAEGLHSLPQSVAAPSPPRQAQSLQSRYGAHPPPGNQMAPRLLSSHTLALSQSPRPLSSPGYSQQQYHRLTPPQPHFLGPDGTPHHLTQPPPSYEHSLHARTPPQMPGSSPSGPRSPQLHHLSPSHTPPPSRYVWKFVSH